MRASFLHWCLATTMKKARLSTFFQPLRYANPGRTAIITSQYVEMLFKFFCVVLKIKGVNFTVDDILSGDSTKARITLGAIEKGLSGTKLFDQNFSDRLSRFVRKRNRIVHGLFADTFKTKDDMKFNSEKANFYIKECEWVCDEGDKLIDIACGIYRTLGSILLKSHPENELLKNVIHHFDSYHDSGLEMLLPQFRPYFK